MILHEGNSIPFIIIIGRERLLIITEPTPVSVIDGISHTVAELKIEGGTGGLVGNISLAIAHPLADFVGTVPILAYAESWLGVHIVISYKIGIETFHHIISEAGIAYVFE